VVILNGHAFVGSNCWYGNRRQLNNVLEHRMLEEFRLVDQLYLSSTIKKLQEYQEVKKIVVITNSIPTEYLSYNKTDIKFPEKLGPSVCLLEDEKHLVYHWLFGSSDILVDATINNRRYCNNPQLSKSAPYWPKRIVITD
jgi:hypothetical protein